MHRSEFVLGFFCLGDCEILVIKTSCGSVKYIHGFGKDTHSHTHLIVCVCVCVCVPVGDWAGLRCTWQAIRSLGCSDSACSFEALTCCG